MKDNQKELWEGGGGGEGKGREIKIIFPDRRIEQALRGFIWGSENGECFRRDETMFYEGGMF